MNGNLRLFLPIVKVDKERRIVEGVATTEAVDKQGEVVDYMASKNAFSEWQGNVREMHEPKAVGKAVEVIPDDSGKQIYVKAYISKGAEDTWNKVKEGILTGFSIGGQTVDKCVQIVKDTSSGSARQVTRITKYKLNELSLVDNPANPEATFALVKRADNGQLEQTELVEDLQKVIVTDSDAMLEAEIKDLRDKADALAKKARTPEELEKMEDDDFGIVRKFSSPQGKLIKERLLPMPDKVHAQTVLRKLGDHPISEEERTQVHNKAKDILGASHKDDECKFCKSHSRKSGGEQEEMNDTMAKELSGKIDGLVERIGKLLKQYEGAHDPKAGAKATPKQEDKNLNPTDAPAVKPSNPEEAGHPENSNLKTQEEHQGHGAAPVTKAADPATSDLQTQKEPAAPTNGAKEPPAVKAKEGEPNPSAPEEDGHPANSNLKTQEEHEGHGAAPVTKAVEGDMPEDIKAKIEAKKKKDEEEDEEPADKVATKKSSESGDLRKLADAVDSLRKEVDTIKKQPLPRRYNRVEKTGDADGDTLQKSYDEIRSWQRANPGKELPSDLAAKREQYLNKSLDNKFGDGSIQKA